MSSKTKLERLLWTSCLLVGSTVLFAEWRVAAHRKDEPERVPEYIVTKISGEADVVRPAAVVDPAPVTEQVSESAESMQIAPIDTRLIGRLLVDSVTQIESAGNPRMVGRHGERGLMQIKAGAWGDVTRRLFGKRVSFDRAFEPKLNQQVGSAYLGELQRFLGKHNRLWRADERSLLLACYNAGPERVKRSGFDLRRLPAHTRDYVKRASALHDALMADNNVDPARIRLAMSATTLQQGG